MKIVPTPFVRLIRAAVHQIEGKFHIDSREYDANWAPTGNQLQFPAVYNSGTSDFGDSNANTLYLNSAYEHGRFYFPDGSMSLSEKGVNGGAPSTTNEPSAILSQVQGYLYQYDSRLPYFFNSVSGLTAGKKYACLNRGIVELKPKYKRALAYGRDPFSLSSYNRLSVTTASSSAQQQIILGESDTELFGMAFGYYSQSYVFPMPGTSQGQSNSAFWRSTKRNSDIDNATAITFVSGATDACEMIFLGVYGDNAICLRINSLGADLTARTSISIRPCSMNVKTGVVSQSTTPLTYQASSAASLGLRFAPHVRSIVETADTITMYIPSPVALPDVVTDGTCIGMGIRRYDFTKATGVWSAGVAVSVVDGPYGDIIAKGPANGDGTSFAQTVVSSWVIDVKGINHLVVMMFGTSNSMHSSNSYTENTHQYVYKINTDGSMTRVSKTISPQLFNTNDVQAGFAMSKDRKAMYLNTYSPRLYRLVFDESIMAYRHDIQYEVDAWTMHVGDDETLTIIDSRLNLYRLLPSMGSAIRVTFGAVSDYAGQPLFTNVNVAAVNHLGERIATQVKLELDGPLSFTVNALQSLTITTSATEDLAVPVQITGVGDIYCTPVKP